MHNLSVRTAMSLIFKQNHRKQSNGQFRTKKNVLANSCTITYLSQTKNCDYVRRMQGKFVLTNLDIRLCNCSEFISLHVIPYVSSSL